MTETATIEPTIPRYEDFTPEQLTDVMDAQQFVDALVHGGQLGGREVFVHRIDDDGNPIEDSAMYGKAVNNTEYVKGPAVFLYENPDQPDSFTALIPLGGHYIYSIPRPKDAANGAGIIAGRAGVHEMAEAFKYQYVLKSPKE